jgi:hypothetical protein
MALTVAQTTDPGAPQAGITIDGLSAVTGCNIVVTVSWDGGLTWNLVRGGTATGVLGSTFMRDFVCPLNVSMTYRAVITGGTTATWTATLTIASSLAWIQDPLAPKSAVSFTPFELPGSVTLLAGSFAAIAMNQPMSLVAPMGSAIPVASVGTRMAPVNVPLILGAAQSQNAAFLALNALLDAAGQVVLRGLPAGVLLDPVTHVLASTVTYEIEGVAPGLYNTLTLAVSQVQPITTRIVVPWWTYDQVKALIQTQVSVGATYAAVLAAQPVGKTYTQWLANPGVV